MKSVTEYSDPKSFVNFLLPPRTRGEGWGGVKNLRLLQGLLYIVRLKSPKESIQDRVALGLV
jgi:hypothetical protein